MGKQNHSKLVAEYKNLLTQKFTNTNRFIIEIKSVQVAYKKMLLEEAGTPVEEIRQLLKEAKKDAVCYLLMELGEFLGDHQMVRRSKSAMAFMQWGIKIIINKLKDLGLEMTRTDITELTIDVCLNRIEKLKQMKGDLQGKIEILSEIPEVAVI